MRKAIFGLAASALALSLGATPAAADPAQVKQAVAADYDSHLEDLFKHFHANPELSFLETETAKRMAAELRAAGLDVTEGVGGTGVVAMARNGEGPLILLRADMDGLPMPLLPSPHFANSPPNAAARRATGSSWAFAVNMAATRRASPSARRPGSITHRQ